MANEYLLSGDYTAYGLPGTTTAAQVSQASTLINGYLKRSEGLVWGPDANGNPAYMVGLNPKLSLTASAGFGPGSAVVVPVSGPRLGQDSVGETVVLDRASTSPNVCETSVIQQVGPGTVQLQSVLFAHSSGATLDLGMSILEERGMPKDRSVTRLARWPIVAILSGLGRYAYGRRDTQQQGLYAEYNLLATVSGFAGPPLWIPFDVTATDVSVATNEVWVPAGLLLAYYSEVRIRYLAGWSQANLPEDIKQACANIVNAVAGLPFTPNVKAYKAGSSQVASFADTVLEADTKAILAPYKARLYI